MADFPLGQLAFSQSTGIGSVSTGITVAASATADTKGSWVELIASTEHDVVEMNVQIPTIAAASATSYFVDIAIGSAGNEEVIISNIHFSTGVSGSRSPTFSFDYPISVPSGSRLSARCQNTLASADSVDVLLTMGSPKFTSGTGFSEAVDFGANTSTSNGVAIDAGGVANTKGAWSEMTTGADELSGFVLSLGANLNTALTTANFLFDVGIGSAGNEEIIAENIFCRTNIDENVFQSGKFCGVSIPANTRIAVRSQSTTINNPDRILSAVLQGIR